MIMQGKVALVTGASRGIGKAIATRLAQSGATVVGTATSEQGAQSITQYLQEIEGAKGFGLVLDVTESSSIEDAMAKLAADVGMPAILVNNAGVTSDNLFLRMKESEWSRIIDANLSGAYRLMKACIKSMVKAKSGRIVNISSVVGFTGNAGQANYSAAKAGLVGLSKSVAQEIASRGITVNVVAPGFIDTDMTKGMTDAQQANLLGQIPMAKMGQPDDIANAVEFLVSDAANYITGETIHVNGGMLMN